MQGTRLRCCAVGDTDVEAVISIGGVLSSMAPHQIAAFERIDWGKGLLSGINRNVRVVNPTTVLVELNIGAIYLMVVDVEGFEWPVIKAFDFDRWKPNVSIIESRDKAPDFREVIITESYLLLSRLFHTGYSIH